MATLTADGLTIRTQSQILAELESDLHSNAGDGDDVDVSAESPTGQIFGTASRQLALLEELIELVWDARDPNKATADGLDGVLALTGTVRDGAHYTRVQATATLTAGTTLESGVHWAEVAGQPGSRWTPEVSYTASTTGSQPVWFRAEFTGPVSVAENTITVIATTVTGWSAINNPTPEILGKLADNDTEARIRREADLARPGSATLAAVAAAAEDVEGVQSATATSNRTDYTDAAGLPPHSLHVLIYDGPTPSADDTEVAQAIFDEIAGTPATYGTSSANAVDEDGTQTLIRFSRVQTVPIYIVMTIKTKAADFPGAVAFKAWLADEANKITQNGTDVLWRRIDSLAFDFAGVLNVTAFAIGTAPAPGSAADITLSPSQRAYYDTANFTVTVTT